MKLTNNEWLRSASMHMRQIPVVVVLMAMATLGMGFVQAANAQAPSTTTVQGTIYQANGHVGSGTLRLSWPSFAAANGQSVIAGSMTATIGPDGFVSVNLAPNLGATPAGLYYTAVFYLSDGSTSTQYWIVPAAAQASLAQVQSQVMPAAQAVQAVSKAYVDQSVAALSQSQITALGGTLNGPLFLNGDPTQGLQAADKHYVDSAVSQANPVSVGNAASGQIAYYTGSGASIGGMSMIPLASGGTGSATAEGALQNLGGISSSATSRQTLAGPLVASTNTEINLQSLPNPAVCDGVTDDTANINGKLKAAGSLSALTIQTMPYFQGTLNKEQGMVKFPFGGICKISGTLIVPPGVMVDLNTATVVTTSTTADAFRFSWDDITDRGSLTWYGVEFGGIENGKIVGLGNTTAQNNGITLYLSAYGKFKNLDIQGFKFGIEGMETSYNNFDHVYTTLNVVGKYLTERGGANGVPVNITGYSVTGGTVTFTAVNGFEQDNVTIAGCNGTNCPTAFNGLRGSNWTTSADVAAVMPPACEKGWCTTFTQQIAGQSGSASGLTGVTATPHASLASLDNVFVDDMSDQNSKIGLWLQTAGQMGAYRGDYSYNQESEIVLGAQPGYADATHPYFISGYTGTFPSGSGCTASTNQPVTFVGGSYGGTFPFYGTPAQAYAKINSSGQVAAIYGVDGGNGYSVLPTSMTVATCSVQPTASVVGTSDAGLGVFDGSSPTNRGGSHFYAARSESTKDLNGPTTGYGVLINAQNDISFTDYCFGVGGSVETTPYARYARNAGARNSFTNPGCSSSSWAGSYGNPAVSGDVSAFQNAGGSLGLRLPWGFMTNPALAVVNGVGAVSPGYMGIDGFSADGTHFSYGYSGSSNGSGGVLLEGNVAPTDGTNQRYILNVNGQVGIGSGGGTFDVGYCRLSSGALGVSDGANSGVSCNSNGNLKATNVTIASAGALYAGTKAIIATGGNQTYLYDAGTGGGVYIYDQGGSYGPLVAANFGNTNGLILPSGLTGYHGTSGTKVQFSDGTGTNGNLVKWASDGSTTDGPIPPAGTIVGTTDTQTLTNKSVAGSEINSGVVGTGFGGTGQDESSATGVGQFSSGAYSVSTALANGTTATTQAAGNNSTKVATTAYVAAPGAIAPTTVTATGLVTGANDATRTNSTTIATTGFTTTGLVLPTVPVGTTKSGRCTIYWQMSSTSYTTTFGFGMNNAPTNLWGGTSVTYAGAGTSNWLAFTQTATTATAISTAATAGVTSTTYRAEIDFTIQTGATNPVALTLYGQVSNASATLTVGPGSTCYWLP